MSCGLHDACVQASPAMCWDLDSKEPRQIDEDHATQARLVGFHLNKLQLDGS